MKRYLIKATITGGLNEGTTYFLRKGGYVAKDPSLCCAEDFYTEVSARAVATKWNRDDEIHQQMAPKYTEPTKYEAVEV